MLIYLECTFLSNDSIILSFQSFVILLRSIDLSFADQTKERNCTIGYILWEGKLVPSTKITFSKTVIIPLKEI